MRAAEHMLCYEGLTHLGLIADIDLASDLAY